jgi:hypothetical protein
MILSRILMVLALAVLAYLVYITMNGSENFKADIQLKKADEKKKLPSNHFIKPFMAPKRENLKNDVDQVNKQQEPFTNNIPKRENVGCSVNPQPQVQMPKQEPFTNNIPKTENVGCSVNPQPEVQMPKQENFVAEPKNIVYEPVVQKNISYDAIPKVESFNNKQNISYESAPKVESFNNKQNITYEKFADVGGIADTVHGAAPFGGKTEMDEGDFAKVSYTGLVDATPGDVIQIEGTDLLTAPLVDNMLYTNSIANTNRNASQDLRGDIPLQFNETYTPFYSSVIYGAPLSEKQMTIGKI